MKKNIVELFEESGLKPAAWCEALGISPATWASYRAGRLAPPSKRMMEAVMIVDNCRRIRKHVVQRGIGHEQKVAGLYAAKILLKNDLISKLASENLINGDLEITEAGERFLAENGIPDLETIKKWLDEYDVL